MCVYLDKRMNYLGICFEWTKITKILDALSRKLKHNFILRLWELGTVMDRTNTKKFSGTERDTATIYDM